MKNLLAKGHQLLKESLKISVVLFKIMIPIIIIVKLLKEFGAVKYVAWALAPVMETVGLPGSMGIVWATTMITNLYGGMVAFASLAGDNPLTVAQVTVLTSMMLIAHTLPIELRVAQKCGCRIVVMAVLRLGGAMIYGWLLNGIYNWCDCLQSANVLLLKPQADQLSLWAWARGEIVNLIFIFFIIFGLLVLMKLLKLLKIADLLDRLLRPILRPLGIGAGATNITVIGMTMGISYGGALIIHETASGNIHKKDIFFAMSLMGLSHSLIEDTLLMVVLGGHISGILVGRVLFALVSIWLLVKFISRISDERFDRYLFKCRRSQSKGNEP